MQHQLQKLPPPGLVHPGVQMNLLVIIGVALVALFFAWRRIFRPARACAPDDACAVPQVRTAYKVIFWIVTALVLIALVFPYLMPLFY